MDRGRTDARTVLMTVSAFFCEPASHCLARPVRGEGSVRGRKEMDDQRVAR